MLRIRNRVLNYIFRNRILILISLFIYTATFLFVLPVVCLGKPYTKFFLLQQSQAQLQSAVAEINQERRLVARAYIAALGAKESLKNYSSVLETKELDLVITVVTVRRSTVFQQLDYLTQVMAHLDKGLKSSQAFPRAALVLCNADAGPGPHDEALDMARYFPMKMRFPKPSPADIIKDKLVKEKEDYAFCLNQTLGYHSKYVMVFQDDALPVAGMFDVIRYALDSRYQLRAGDRNWAFLKLYYPERWQGYSYDLQAVLELIGLALLGGFCFHVMYSWLHTNKHYSTTAFGIGVIYAVMVASIVGRQNVQSWRRLSVQTHHVVPAKDCCTPAVLYPHAMAARLVDFLQAATLRHGEAVDMLVDTFAEQNNFLRYAIEPNIVKHIGMYSSLSSAIKSPEEFLT